MSNLTPREIVSELDKFIIGQADAKRMVAIAMRNRWRRQQLPAELRDEVSPKNIIMMGPTGVGKTEIARRLAKLSGCPFFKVEATKFTEVGYVGRDVESMVRDLMEIGITLVRKEELQKVKVKAEKNAEECLLDILLPSSKPQNSSMGFFNSSNEAIPLTEENPSEDKSSTRDKFRKMWRDGKLDDREVEIEVTVQGGTGVEIMSVPGMEDMGMQVNDMIGKMFPNKKKTRKVNIREAYELLIQEESDKLIDMDNVTEIARERVEQTGILFLDEIDKIAGRHETGGSTDVSREGVQRDLLPIVEGCVVNTKYGMVKTDHILFISAGAFHFSKPSDLIPELQGRFPLRVELSALGKDEFYRILTEPQNALTVQYKALLETEQVTIDYSKEALEEVAATAQKINEDTENIGARRLYTIMEKILAELSFEAPDRSGDTILIDKDYVKDKLKDVIEDRDLSRYIL
ncbi:ATP-dependent HslUV protease ATP-binding subunit HslU [Maridesulfovibrio ferrireducens]|uniref:ATP-dependent protease ATPase subunit HslU n=1 Tax=Maridesulfovibrio ferrireducens TaxID=246191 RepID=A0A1G9FLF0_9BACT|nr:ATP-dependent protease ATPase subunit HslU [Maridesulfovibrio ferrireducens]SDK89185.1 ATP-dependent HslUV protease ATP-binding subunit HslU [Maridesulfovibrio ferrireducens]